MLKVLSALPWPVTRASQAALYKLDVKAEGTTLRAKAFVQARNTSWKPFASRLQKAFRHGHSHGFTTPRGTLSAAYHDRAQQENADIPLEPGLYLVGTPIGNLEDISLRALRILRTATIVLAEDTRHSKKLLNHFNIKAQLYSFHQHNENSKEQVVLDQLARGSSVAVISDAGMPLISDPGSSLVQAAVAAGFQVNPIPGPSAFLLALVASGLASTQFTFAGFLADKTKTRQRQLQDLADVSHTLVFYVPPHDLLTVLNSAATILGANRQCVIARELTKVHEEFFRSTIADAVEHFGSTAAKGEITLLIQGAEVKEADVSADDLGAAMTAAMASGQSLSSAAKIVSKQLEVSRSKAYAAALAVTTSRDLSLEDTEAKAP